MSNTPVAKNVSPLSKYLPAAVPQEPKTKTGHARVLTSNDCIEMLEEKKRKKEQEAKEKEERKVARERQKIAREQLLQKKKEERLKRQEAALKKKQEVAAKKAAAAAKKKSSSVLTRSRGQRAPLSRVATMPHSSATIDGPSSASTAPSTTAPPSSVTIAPPSVTTAPPCLSANTADDNTTGPSHHQDSTMDCECTFCYRSFCQDGEEWVRCACGRWVHEQCMEDVFLDDNCEERFCPFCLN